MRAGWLAGGWLVAGCWLTAEALAETLLASARTHAWPRHGQRPMPPQLAQCRGGTVCVCLCVWWCVRALGGG